MAFSFGFYNAVEGDRRYNAEQVSAIFDGLITDGVYDSIGDIFATTAGTGLQVLVGTGKAWLHHTWNVNDSIMPLNLDQADILLPRIDAVVIEVNNEISVRANSIKIVKGTPGSIPQKPTLLRTSAPEGVNQYALAYVTVPANATSIKSTNIEINVGKSTLPFVTSIVQSTDIDALFNQWNGEFDEWFENLKEQLSDNVVTNLQKQIDNANKRIDDVTSDLSKTKTSVSNLDKHDGLIKAEDGSFRSFYNLMTMYINGEYINYNTSNANKLFFYDGSIIVDAQKLGSNEIEIIDMKVPSSKKLSVNITTFVYADNDILIGYDSSSSKLIVYDMNTGAQLASLSGLTSPPTYHTNLGPSNNYVFIGCSNYNTSSLIATLTFYVYNKSSKTINQIYSTTYKGYGSSSTAKLVYMQYKDKALFSYSIPYNSSEYNHGIIAILDISGSIKTIEQKTSSRLSGIIYGPYYNMITADDEGNFYCIKLKTDSKYYLTKYNYNGGLVKEETSPTTYTRRLLFLYDKKVFLQHTNNNPYFFLYDSESFDYTPIEIYYGNVADILRGSLIFYSSTSTYYDYLATTEHIGRAYKFKIHNGLFMISKDDYKVYSGTGIQLCGLLME